MATSSTIPIPDVQHSHFSRSATIPTLAKHKTIVSPTFSVHESFSYRCTGIFSFTDIRSLDAARGVGPLAAHVSGGRAAALESIVAEKTPRAAATAAATRNGGRRAAAAAAVDVLH